jgi:hypothetical protein
MNTIQVTLTVDSINSAINNYFWMDATLSAIINEAEKKGYILRTSHTQAEWIEEGLKRAKQEIPYYGEELIKAHQAWIEAEIKADTNEWEIGYKKFNAAAKKKFRIFAALCEAQHKDVIKVSNNLYSPECIKIY